MAILGAPFDRSAFDDLIFDCDDQGGNFYEDPKKVRKQRRARLERG